jgi:RNA-directed DNA polymerase
LAQKFDYPKTEKQLQDIQDKMFEISKTTKENGERPSFKGILELVQSEVVIITAIHNIKSNKGINTAGTDGNTMQEDFLNKPYEEVIETIKSSLNHYKPRLIRRVYIPKPGKSEKRKLGIPSIIDRIIQECLKIVIEPVFEAQFYKHSYGFRPMRSTDIALEAMTRQVARTGQTWVIEGDISKFFDSINHRKLLKRMWHMGIKDRRILMIVKEMLKSGVMDEVEVTQEGAIQGGNISPLLANVYLDMFDEWVTKQWTHKKTRYQYKDEYITTKILKRDTNLQTAYLVRYCDDWTILTDTKTNAENWKRRIQRFLEKRLKLKLSDEKTLITNIKTRCIKFLGFEFKVVKGNSRTGYITRTMPNRANIRNKVKNILFEIKKLKKITKKGSLIHAINIVNSMIRGIINYFNVCTWVYVALKKYSQVLTWAGYRALKSKGGEWIEACKVDNLTSVHENYATVIPSIEYKGLIIGITSLEFCKWSKILTKNQKETPYSPEGRRIYIKYKKKKPLKIRADELLSVEYSELISKGKTTIRYNFEYFMNRAYAFNRDKSNCRVCGKNIASNLHTHHIKPNLELTQVNKVPNLASTHNYCHNLIHSNQDYSDLGKKAWNKITGFREKLI